MLASENVDACASTKRTRESVPATAIFPQLIQQRGISRVEDRASGEQVSLTDPGLQAHHHLDNLAPPSRFALVVLGSAEPPHAKRGGILAWIFGCRIRSLLIPAIIRRSAPMKIGAQIKIMAHLDPDLRRGRAAMCVPETKTTPSFRVSGARPGTQEVKRARFAPGFRVRPSAAPE